MRKEGAEKGGAIIMMSHEPYLILYLNLIQIIDKKIRRNKSGFIGKFWWHEKLLPYSR